MSRFFIGAALIFCTMHSFGAAVVYSNGDPDGIDGFHSDFSGYASAEFLQIGDDFQLAGPTVIGGFHWFGLYAYDTSPAPVPVPGDDFVIRVFRMSGGSPETTPVQEFHVAADVARKPLGSAMGTFALYDYRSIVGEFTLESGDYLLSIVDNTAVGVNDWFCADSKTGSGNVMQRTGDGMPWAHLNDRGGAEMAFSIEVPEPSILGLAAVATLMCWRRRIKF